MMFEQHKRRTVPNDRRVDLNMLTASGRSKPCPQKFFTAVLEFLTQVESPARTRSQSV
jgi:hypothetical protein